MKDKLLAGITFLLPSLLFFSALTLAPYFILLAIICMVPLFKPSVPTPILALLALLLLWPLASSLWSIIPSETLPQWAAFLGTCITGILVCQQSRARPLPQWVWIGMSMSFLFCCLLLLAEKIPARGLLTWFSSSMGSDPIKFIHQNINRGVSAYAVLIWPLLMALQVYRQRLLTVCLFIAFTLVLVLVPNLSARLGLLVGTVTFLLVCAKPQIVPKILVFAMPLIFFVGPIVLDMSLQSVYVAKNFDQLQIFSGGRVFIWQALVEHALPPNGLLGWGMHTSARLPLSDAVIQQMAMPHMPMHPHNTMLQLRLELGWIGLFLVSASIGLVLHLIARVALDRKAKALAMATAISYIATGACSYNIWQSWWMALPWITWFLWQRMPHGDIDQPLLWGLKRFLILFISFIGLLGLLPHGLFSFDLGEWHYMANAWDEDSYALFTFAKTLPVYRQLSGTVLTLLQQAWDLDTALILIDVIPPILAATFAALIVYYIGFRSIAGLFLASCLLLFALPFMAFSSAALVGVPITQLLPFSSLLYPEWIRMFVPNLFENFLNLYKSPEPQISMVVQFATLLLLLRHAQTHQWRYLVALALVSLIFPFIYITTGIALVVCIACYGALAWWAGRQRYYLWIMAIAVGAAVFAAVWYLRQPPASAASVFLFHSRLPVISASVIWAVLLAWPLMRQWSRPFMNASQRSTIPATALFAFACCLVPLITLNQQIITGVMVQSRTWDYYTNMPFVALALLLGWPGIHHWIRAMTPTRIAPYLPSAKLVAVGLAAWLCWAQIYVYQYYSPSNVDNLAVARSITDLHARYPKAKLMLETTGDDSQIALRMGNLGMDSIAGYRQCMKHFAAPLSASPQSYGASIAVIKEQAFTYFDHRGLTPEALEKLMLDEAKAANAGPHIIYFFSLLDSWRAASDHRLHNVKGMTKKIPQLIEDYQAFLSHTKRRSQYDDVLYVTRTKRPAPSNAPWKENLADTMTLGSRNPITIYVYRQHWPR